MAKDDYYVIVYKILAYLYVQLKAGEKVDPEIISAHGPNGILLDINERYWTYIIVNMLDQGLIRDVNIEKPWGDDIVVSGLENCEITPAGIDYVCNHSLMERAKAFLKDIKEITPFI